MLDNLRSDSQADFIPLEEPEQVPTAPVVEKTKIKRSFDQVTGTTALQRFILATLMLVTVCLVGFLLLVLMGKIVPNFLF